MSEIAGFAIDQLVLTVAPLQPIDSFDMQAVETSVVLPAAYSARRLQFPLPICIREFGPKQLEKNWLSFCKTLNQHRIPFYGSASDLKALPVTAIPRRIARRYLDEALDPTDLTTADAVELECRPRSRSHWGWPADVSAKRLAAWITSIRIACGGDTPIGLSLPLGAVARDIERALGANVDFLTLVAAGSPDGSSIGVQDLAGIMTAREACRNASKPELPLIVDVPARHADDLVKLIALGATLVVMDHWISQQLPKPSPKQDATGALGSGMLKGIAVPLTKSLPLDPLEQALTELRASLKRGMLQVGAASLRDLEPNKLRTASPAVAQITGVEML